jgi:enoyl-CoA hydratase/carnithine racemase
MGETIRVVREGRLVEVVLNRPDKLNSINRLMLSELREALEEATEAPARALLLRGAGARFRRGAILRKPIRGTKTPPRSCATFSRRY